MSEDRRENEGPEEGLGEEIARDVERSLRGEAPEGGDEGLGESIARDIKRELRGEAREAEREARRAERDARRAERQAEREERRQERHAHRMHLLGGHLTIETDEREETEDLERRFTVEGMPRIRVRNVSGDTAVGVGNAGEVIVRARKRVRGWSADRAKRLLENVEIRMEQHGDQIIVEPTLYQQERGWMDLFRGGRATVDIEIAVPKEAQIEATTVSGPLTVTSTRGPLETRRVSGRIEITDVQGPLRLRTVSGDLRASGYAGQAEANAVSGDMRFMRSRIKRPDIVSVSGDVEIEGALVGAKDDGEGRIKTVSGDIELILAEEALELDFHSLSGDVEVDAFRAKVEKRGRREWHVEIGQGGPRIRAKTVSGDLTIRRSGEDRPAEAEAQSEEPMPMAAPAAPGADVREMLQRVARGEMSVEDAASALDEGR